MMDLDAQVAVLRDQLNALGRQVREVTEAAGEQDKPDVVDALADVRMHLNDAAAVLGDVIV
ncbi:hypothetical protein [Rhodococcus opacus]|uniref:Uncharacterized protein n=1 Tax=Rhodococcus opacus (strain B4) TaxID=632772 RepID=C1BEF7_RHOOB|nr:hypothetical protein [Rhodococcus opacus]BAH47258.1 hypothetical protein ROP_pKNR01-00050 [Rhodococcus opacus B4]